MDIKKIDKIKAPEDWVEEALNPEKMKVLSVNIILREMRKK